MKVRYLTKAIIHVLGMDLNWDSKRGTFELGDTIQGRLANQIFLDMDPALPDPFEAHVEKVAKELEGTVTYKEWETTSVPDGVVH